MGFEQLLAHVATQWRRPPPTEEYGTPIDQDFEVINTFPCRLSFEGGFETPDPNTGQRVQSRQGRVFCLPEVDIRRGDLLSLDAFPGARFEIGFNRIVYGFSAPHHWELDVTQYEGT